MFAELHESSLGTSTKKLAREDQNLHTARAQGMLVPPSGMLSQTCYDNSDDCLVRAGDPYRDVTRAITVRVEDELADRTAVEQRPVRVGGVGRAGKSRRSPARSEPSASRPIRSVTASASMPGAAATCTSQKPITAWLRAISTRASIGDGAVRPAMPNTASRPSGASAARLWSKTGRRSSRARCRRACRRWPHAARRSGRRRASRPRRRRRARAPAAASSSLRRRGDHPAGAPPLRQLDRDGADPAGAGVHDDALARLQVRRGAQQVPRRRALHERGQRGAVATPRPASGTAGAGRAAIRSA